MTTLFITLLALLLGMTLASPQGKGDNVGGSPFRSEQKSGNGKTRGEYGFRSPDGCLHVISYETDQRAGYRVLGSSKKDCNLETTTKRSTTTTATTTTTSPKLQDPLSVPPVSVVADNTVIEESQGRQLQQPNLASAPPSYATTAKPEDEPKPLYSFGFTTPTHGHTETGLPDGSKKGEYYWDSPDGWRRIVTYVANEKGFYPRIRQVRISTTTPKTVPGTNPDNLAKELGPEVEEEIAIPVGGCPYYFYYNTRINYHWERCYENNTKVGEYGSLGSDGYAHKNAYYADATGFHPTLSKAPLTARQLEIMAEYTEDAFIIPKPDEERRETEKRILAWLADNRERVQKPLR
ncbi:uncharacterized protein [Panulirus ornatus]|uniref:uncharacterized protein n=1 Tax=Panulirus ornatus TaxID=150431 RepID=UPI003A8C27A4